MMGSKPTSRWWPDRGMEGSFGLRRTNRGLGRGIFCTCIAPEVFCSAQSADLTHRGGEPRWSSPLSVVQGTRPLDGDNNGLGWSTDVIRNRLTGWGREWSPRLGLKSVWPPGREGCSRSLSCLYASLRCDGSARCARSFVHTHAHSSNRIEKMCIC